MSSTQKPKMLEPTDLVEYKLRQAALDSARHQYVMVQEAYQGWVQRMGKKYRIKGVCDIDADTGILTPRLAPVEQDVG